MRSFSTIPSIGLALLVSTNATSVASTKLIDGDDIDSDLQLTDWKNSDGLWRSRSSFSNL